MNEIWTAHRNTRGEGHVMLGEDPADPRAAARAAGVTNVKLDWGNVSAGADLLALYILATILPIHLASNYSGLFVDECIRKLPYDQWAMTRRQVVAWLVTKRVTWELAVGPGAVVDVVDDGPDEDLSDA